MLWGRESNVDVDQNYDFKNNRQIWYMRVNRALGWHLPFSQEGGGRRGSGVGEDAVLRGWRKRGCPRAHSGGLIPSVTASVSFHQ